MACAVFRPEPIDNITASTILKYIGFFTEVSYELNPKKISNKEYIPY